MESNSRMENCYGNSSENFHKQLGQILWNGTGAHKTCLKQLRSFVYPHPRLFKVVFFLQVFPVTVFMLFWSSFAGYSSFPSHSFRWANIFFLQGVHIMKALVMYFTNYIIHFTCFQILFSASCFQTPLICSSQTRYEIAYFYPIFKKNEIRLIKLPVCLSVLCVPH
jgi:hypothetical protein